MIYNSYVLQDRITGTKYAISFVDGERLVTSTTATANPEPIFRDTVNTSDYWRLFISDGDMGIESVTGTVQNDDIVLTDIPGNTYYKLTVIDGEFSSSQQILNAFVLVDRVTATHYAITYSNGERQITDVTYNASPEPILRDTFLPSTYWKVFMSDGELAIESTATVQDDLIVINDLPGNTFYRLIVVNGELATLENPSSNLQMRVNVFVPGSNRLLICRVQTVSQFGSHCRVTVLRKATSNLQMQVSAQTLTRRNLVSRVSVLNKSTRFLQNRVSIYKRVFRSLFTRVTALIRTNKPLVIRVTALKKSTRTLTSRLIARKTSARSLITRLIARQRSLRSLVSRIEVFHIAPAVGELRMRVTVLRKSSHTLVARTTITHTRTGFDLVARITALRNAFQNLGVRLLVTRARGNRLMSCSVDVTTYALGSKDLTCRVQVTSTKATENLTCSLHVIGRGGTDLKGSVLVTPEFTGSYTVQSHVWPSIDLTSDGQRFGGYV